MEPDDAQRTLREVGRLRLNTRQALHPIWYSNLVVGTFFAGAALVSAVASDGLVGLVYWVVGIPLGLALIVRYYVRLERELGLESRGWDASVAIVVAIVVAILAVNLLSDGDAGAIAPLYPAAAGTFAIGIVLRDPIEAAAGVAMALVATAILLADPSEPWIWGNLGLGLTLLAAGVAGRIRGGPLPTPARV